jgi:hypothetical protein
MLKYDPEILEQQAEVDANYSRETSPKKLRPNEPQKPILRLDKCTEDVAYA